MMGAAALFAAPATAVGAVEAMAPLTALAATLAATLAMEPDVVSVAAPEEAPAEAPTEVPVAASGTPLGDVTAEAAALPERNGLRLRSSRPLVFRTSIQSRLSCSTRCGYWAKRARAF